MPSLLISAAYPRPNGRGHGGFRRPMGRDKHGGRKQEREQNARNIHDHDLLSVGYSARAGAGLVFMVRNVIE